VFDFITLAILAFIMEMIDNGLGGGFGTILSPLLILFGYDPIVVVPAILVSETVSGIWGGAWHWKFGNVNWKVVGLTLIGSLSGMALATYITGAVLQPATLKLIIAIMAVIMGAFVVLRAKFRERIAKLDFSKHPILFSIMGAIIGYNKGTSGGNYGPFSVSGYMVLGLSAATAIGTTTVAEGIACALGVAMYSQITGIVLSVAIPLSIGSFIADPISAWVNNHLKNKLHPNFHNGLIGFVMMLVGTVALLKVLGFIK